VNCSQLHFSPAVISIPRLSTFLDHYVICLQFLFNFSVVYNDGIDTERYGDGAGNTTANSKIFSLSWLLVSFLLVHVFPHFIMSYYNIIQQISLCNRYQNQVTYQINHTNSWWRYATIFAILSWLKAIVIAITASVPESTAVSVRWVKVPVYCVVGTWPGIPGL